MRAPVQFVIIAGGLGTRLRPLTLRRPKALLPLLNRPQILHVLDRLPMGCDRVVVAVNYLYEQVRDYFEVLDSDVEVVVVNEPQPLGTGGAIKNVEDHVSGTFAVANGDVIDRIDFEGFLKFHRRHRGIGSLGVGSVEDPTAYGVVALDGERITRFVEKPQETEAPSNLANAGRYLLEPEVFDAIEAGRVVSMEREVFPKLIPRGLYAFREEGYWSDAGTLPAYLEAQRFLLEDGGSGLAKGAEVSRADLLSHVLVAPGCFVEGHLGPNAVLGKGCKVGRSVVRNAALFDGVSVDDKVEIDTSIVGEGAAIGEGALVRNSIVGDGVQVLPHARLLGARVDG
ncbi:MAG TPA: NDP-sugar synthase [Thermoplasmata archaeon]|nr:NDP-sugar synthase [Thermoplasmata archaeon]